MITGSARTVKICSCGQAITRRATLAKHRVMGHKIEVVQTVKNYMEDIARLMLEEME